MTMRDDCVTGSARCVRGGSHLEAFRVGALVHLGRADVDKALAEAARLGRVRLRNAHQLYLAVGVLHLPLEEDVELAMRKAS